MIAHSTQEHVTSLWRHATIGELRKRCCHAVRHEADSAAAMEHMISRHSHQQRNRVFRWVRSEAVTRPTELTSVSKRSRIESSWTEYSAVWSQWLLQWDRRQPTRTWSREHGSWKIYCIESSYQTTGKLKEDWGGFLRAVVNCRVCELAIVLHLLVFTFCECSIN
jgi:hypothetical protein